MTHIILIAIILFFPFYTIFLKLSKRIYPILFYACIPGWCFALLIFLIGFSLDKDEYWYGPTLIILVPYTSLFLFINFLVQSYQNRKSRKLLEKLELSEHKDSKSEISLPSSKDSGVILEKPEPIKNPSSSSITHYIDNVPDSEEPKETSIQTAQYIALTEDSYRQLPISDTIGLLNGNNTFTFCNGEIYIGEWSAGKMNGNGTLTKT